MKWLLLAVCVMLVGGAAGQWAVNPSEIPSQAGGEHSCRMWGECYYDGRFWKNCRYDGPALQLLHAQLSAADRATVIDTLERRCPHLLYDEDGQRKADEDIYTCCASEQVIGMEESFMLLDSVLGRCPACTRNYLRQVCEMNCSPQQSRFVNVSTVVEETLGLEYVDRVEYRMHEEFMEEAHAACSGVMVPQTGMPAINLMCGNAAVCDAEAWFGFGGDTSQNPFAPVEVNFLKWPTREDSMDVAPLSCNDTFPGDSPCSCVDCNRACPVGLAPLAPSACTVLAVNCVGFSIGVTLLVVGVIIFVILTIIDYVKTRKNVETKPVDVKEFQVSGLIRFFQKLLSGIGTFSAGNPVLVILLTSWLVFGMFFGVQNINITADRMEIWSNPDSRSREHFDYYNSRFGPFYRAAQVFMQFNGLESFVVDNVTYGPAYRIEAIQELVDLENDILNIGREDGGVTIEDVCFAPLRSPGSTEPNLDLCVTMSASTYLSNRNNINNATYLSQIISCLNNYYGLECLASWGGGAEPTIAFGGYDGDDIYSADTLVMNFPLANHLLQENLKPVLEWELNFINLLQNYNSNFANITFGAERSIEDEITRVSMAEVVPITVSYVLMFIYVILALGKVKSCKTFFSGSKILVAFGSITIEILAIFCALGTMGFLGIKTTLLAINVIPFFILSVGIDNVFLMVNTLHDVDSNIKTFSDFRENLTGDARKKFIFSKMMERIGPSIFITSITQITCFSIGTMANFPAVVTFAIFATFSLAFLFVFQMTTVVAVISLDYTRESQNRWDVFFCIKRKMLDDTNPLTSEEPYRSLTQRFMTPYSKFILDWRVKIIVAIIFILITSVSIILTPQIEVGLDQELALPSDSYVYGYLQSISTLFKQGVPVYFVLKAGLNFSDPLHQNVVCGGPLCYDDSLTTQIFLAAQYSDITFIDRSANSWLDDFIDWSTLPGTCCKYNTEDGSFCQSASTSLSCDYCSIDREENGIRPTGEAFARYIPFFLQDEPTDICNKGGLASYYSNVNYLLNDQGLATVYDSNFMTYHTQLSTSTDYITAVKYGYEVSENITAAIRRHTGLDVEVFPYAVFYPFYEQYLTMWSDTFASIGYSLIGVLVITLLTSGFNFLTTFAVVVTTIMVVANMMGLMYIWSIPLNAVSCVNLIVSIGIAVEFCSHIAYAYAASVEPPRERVGDALKKVGATIITGITLTNIPIIVLAFSYTELIEVFFFRMFFGLVVIGFFHGMVFLPVFLSYLNNLIKA